MFLFFGRINVNQNPGDQFQNAYFQAQKGTSYFAELNQFESFNREPVYVFMIAGNSVELWKADHWSEDEQNLFFQKTNVSLDNMNRAWFAAFKFFFLDADLIVFTTRRPYKKAFFKLNFDEFFTEDMLLNPATYADSNNYRSIELHASMPDIASRNLIFYKKSAKWHFKLPDFFDGSLLNDFRDNTDNIGKGRSNKDNTLRLINDANPLPAVYDADSLTLMNVYDVFFCDYNGNVEDEILLKQQECFYKVSMSAKDISEDAFNYLIERNLIAVHKDTKGKGTSYETQGDTFVNKMKVGDYFYLSRGNQRFVLIGKVVGNAEPCEFEDLGEEGWMQRKFVSVKLAFAEEKYEGENKWWTPNNNSTFIVIPDADIQLANSLIFAPYFSVVVKKNQTGYPSQPLQSFNGSSMHLNTILFGPPGTGKTYALQQLIKDWDLIEKADLYSLNYDSFVDGYAWWELVAIALLDLKQATVPQLKEHPLIKTKFNNSAIKSFNARLWSTLQNHTVRHCENVQLQDRLGGSLIFFKEKNSIWRLDNESEFKASFPELVEEWDRFRNPSNKSQEVKKYIFATCHQSLSYEDFIEGIKPILTERDTIDSELSITSVQYEIRKGLFYKACNKACQLAGYANLDECLQDTKANRVKRFNTAVKENNIMVLFLDEINRCNVSAVFGELITLIENDKRLGAKNEIADVVLPYSQKLFGVPGNLYIIGTMNTADRSIEALDTALRRRFSFESIQPTIEPIKEKQIGDIYLSQMLAKINERVLALLSSDHLIGHSYFIDISTEDDLKAVFKNKIIPLLQEYFYNDYGKIGLVLGNAFVESKRNSVQFPKNFEYEDKEELAEGISYTIITADRWTTESFKSIYID
ncbi:hypothetical protein HNQ91_000598 [Filimonas zeae]|uniref:AAA+ ATPase domain-containing protein n=1 Tax=Filimonas zeae TaxID=1737353 RepID=A0A917MRP7_9BACT|nr:AAA family ATPase [Filimonas zeae]MDR6337576.1 hypothetical protein [Filimonas zeae]GGH59284.1 hypothetical protein GCM10011379_05890 [Filimonas zeae]